MLKWNDTCWEGGRAEPNLHHCMNGWIVSSMHFYNNWCIKCEVTSFKLCSSLHSTTCKEQSLYILNVKIQKTLLHITIEMSSIILLNVWDLKVSRVLLLLCNYCCLCCSSSYYYYNNLNGIKLVLSCLTSPKTFTHEC